MLLIWKLGLGGPGISCKLVKLGQGAPGGLGQVGAAERASWESGDSLLGQTAVGQGCRLAACLGGRGNQATKSEEVAGADISVATSLS